MTSNRAGSGQEPVDETPPHPLNEDFLGCPSLLEEVASLLTERERELERLKSQIKDSTSSAVQPTASPPPPVTTRTCETTCPAANAADSNHRPLQQEESLPEIEKKEETGKKYPRTLELFVAFIGISIVVLFLCVGAWQTAAISYRYLRGIDSSGDRMATPPRDSKLHDQDHPYDPFASAVRYGHDPKSSAKMILYPMHPDETGRAMRANCQMPSNFSLATRRLVQDGSSFNVQTERGLISLRDLRYSLQMYVIKNDYDFMCSQLLDVPLCYCVAVVVAAAEGERVSGPRKLWLDISGRLNLTCVSTGATVYSSEENVNCPAPRKPSKRFKTVCVEHMDMHGITWRRVSTGVEAVVMQQIFEVHRGLDPCQSSLVRTLRTMENEGAERGGMFRDGEEEDPYGETDE
jgi:hypothetical protein